MKVEHFAGKIGRANLDIVFPDLEKWIKENLNADAESISPEHAMGLFFLATDLTRSDRWFLMELIAKSPDASAKVILNNSPELGMFMDLLVDSVLQDCSLSSYVLRHSREPVFSGAKSNLRSGHFLQLAQSVSQNASESGFALRSCGKLTDIERWILIYGILDDHMECRKTLAYGKNLTDVERRIMAQVVQDHLDAQVV